MKTFKEIKKKREFIFQGDRFVKISPINALCLSGFWKGDKVSFLYNAIVQAEQSRA